MGFMHKIVNGGNLFKMPVYRPEKLPFAAFGISILLIVTVLTYTITIAVLNSSNITTSSVETSTDMPDKFTITCECQYGCSVMASGTCNLAYTPDELFLIYKETILISICSGGQNKLYLRSNTGGGSVFYYGGLCYAEGNANHSTSLIPPVTEQAMYMGTINGNDLSLASFADAGGDTVQSSQIEMIRVRKNDELVNVDVSRIDKASGSCPKGNMTDSGPAVFIKCVQITIEPTFVKQTTNTMGYILSIWGIVGGALTLITIILHVCMMSMRTFKNNKSSVSASNEVEMLDIAKPPDIAVEDYE